MTHLLLATAAVALALVAGWLGGRCASLRSWRPPPPAPRPVDYQLILPPPPRAREPWQDLHPEAIELPLDLVHHYADPGERQRAAAETDRVVHLVDLITTEGIHSPLWMLVDDSGRAVLEDGNHRLQVATIIGRTTWPVIFRNTDRITGWGRPVHALVLGLADLVEDRAASGDSGQA